MASQLALNPDQTCSRRCSKISSSLQLPPQLGDNRPRLESSHPHTWSKKHSNANRHRCFRRRSPGHLLDQNISSVPIPLTSYIREAIFALTLSSVNPSSTVATANPPHRHLLWRGTFRAHPALHFAQVSGIELFVNSIRFALHNVELNELAHKISFRAGDATQIISSQSPLSTTTAIAATRRSCGSYLPFPRRQPCR